MDEITQEQAKSEQKAEKHAKLVRFFSRAIQVVCGGYAVFTLAFNTPESPWIRLMWAVEVALASMAFITLIFDQRLYYVQKNYNSIIWAYLQMLFAVADEKKVQKKKIKS